MKLFKVYDNTGYSDRWFSGKREARQYLNSLEKTYDDATLSAVTFKLGNISREKFMADLLNGTRKIKEIPVVYTIIEYRDFLNPDASVLY